MQGLATLPLDELLPAVDIVHGLGQLLPGRSHVFNNRDARGQVNPRYRADDFLLECAGERGNLPFALSLQPIQLYLVLGHILLGELREGLLAGDLPLKVPEIRVCSRHFTLLDVDSGQVGLPGRPLGIDGCADLRRNIQRFQFELNLPSILPGNCFLGLLNRAALVHFRFNLFGHGTPQSLEPLGGCDVNRPQSEYHPRCMGIICRTREFTFQQWRSGPERTNFAQDRHNPAWQASPYTTGQCPQSSALSRSLNHFTGLHVPGFYFLSGS